MNSIVSKLICYVKNMNTLIPVNNVYVVVIFLSQVIFVYLLFLGMVIYANENETKRNKNYLR